MKNEKLLRAIGDIDDRFIEEADIQAVSNRRTRGNLRYFAAAAASIAVVVIAAIIAVSGKAGMPARSNDTMHYSEPTSNTAAPIPASNTAEMEGPSTANAAVPADASSDKSITADTRTNEGSNDLDNDKASEAVSSVPEEFSFSLVWGCNGISSYDSRTGKLVKASDTDHTEDYTTTYYMSSKEIEEVYKLIEEMGPETYPDDYDPIKGHSKPSRDIILTVSYNGNTKTIKCIGIGLGDEPADEEGARFMAVHDIIVQILTSTDEWEALPEYEHLYS